MNEKLPSIFVSLEQFENITVIENNENPLSNNIINTFKTIDIIDIGGEEYKKIYTIYKPFQKQYLKPWKVQVIDRVNCRTLYFSDEMDAFLFLSDEIKKSFVPLFENTQPIIEYQIETLKLQNKRSEYETLTEINKNNFL